MTKYVKLEDNELIFPPVNIEKNGCLICNYNYEGNYEMLLEDGWKPLIEAEGYQIQSPIVGDWDITKPMGDLRYLGLKNDIISVSRFSYFYGHPSIAAAHRLHLRPASFLSH